jgi:hypothetical protein
MRRPSCDTTIDLDSLAARTDGWTAAALAKVLRIDSAAQRVRFGRIVNRAVIVKVNFYCVCD